MECSLCSYKTDPDQNVIFENDLAVYTQKEKYQGSLKYSGVIIPKAHKETVFDMTEDEILASFELLHKVKDWIDSKYQPDGYNIGWNCGKVGGQLELHAHLHVIPRFKQEPLAGAGIRSHLKGEQNRW
jgi:histidine triad (HIT) family protein